MSFGMVIERQKEKVREWGRRDLNPEPPAPKAGVIPS